jgi:hypothetical protein
LPVKRKSAQIRSPSIVVAGKRQEDRLPIRAADSRSTALYQAGVTDLIDQTFANIRRGSHRLTLLLVLSGATTLGLAGIACPRRAAAQEETPCRTQTRP